ncbi:hypothetical protein [Weissella coleopterorum]|nr:hypothetical protein [Weissella coleopterorum]
MDDTKSNNGISLFALIVMVIVRTIEAFYLELSQFSLGKIKKSN